MIRRDIVYVFAITGAVLVVLIQLGLLLAALTVLYYLVTWTLYLALAGLLLVMPWLLFDALRAEWRDARAVRQEWR